jgi:4-amino-4-deoxy-L-arabinose transferase-like glycosyltransferase
MARSQKYAPVMLIFFLALLVRLVYNLTAARHYAAVDDAGLYNQIAYSIVYEHCFCMFPHQPEISRAPLWPLLLSIVYRFTAAPNLAALNAGVQVLYGRLLNSLIGSGTCALVYLLARDLVEKRIALITGILAAVYTGLFIYDGWLYAESLYTFLLTGFIYSLCRLQQTRQRRWILISGLSLGLANLTRPNGPLLFAMLFLWAIGIVLAKVASWQTAVKSTLGITCIALAMIAPWTLRNYAVTHSFVPVAIGTGDVLLGSYNDNVLRGTTGFWTGSSNITPRPDLSHVVLAGKDTPQYTVEDDQIATDYALHWMLMHWRDMPRLLAYHLLNMWIPFTSAEHGFPFGTHPKGLSSNVVFILTEFMPFPVYALALLGLLVTWQYRKKQFLIVYIVIALTIVENLAFWGDMRFRAPIEPLLVLLAGSALWWFTDSEFANSPLRRHLQEWLDLVMQRLHRLRQMYSPPQMNPGTRDARSSGAMDRSDPHV